MLLRLHPAVVVLVLAPLSLGCPGTEPPATETEASSSTTADPSTTTITPPTTLDSSGTTTTVGPDTTTTSGDTTTTGSDGTSTSSSGGSTDDTTTGAVVCDPPFEVNEDIGSMVGLAVVMNTNLGAGDHYEDLCGLRTFGFETDTDFGTDTEVFPGTDTVFGTTFFPGTDSFPTSGFTDSFGGTGLSATSFGGTGGFTDTFPGTTGFASFGDTGFDTGFEPPTYEEYLVRWTAPSAGTYRIDLVGSDYDTLLGIADACGMGELACNDDCFGLQSGLALDVDDGQTITIIIGGYAGQTGEFVLNIEEDAALECGGI
jgi:hypothetical protein